MRWLIPAVVLVASAAGARADVLWSDGTPVTLPEVRKRHEKDTGGQPLNDRWLRVAAEGFEPRQSPKLGTKPSGAPALPFLARVNVLGNFTQVPGEGRFYLIASDGIGGNPTILGWVPVEWLIGQQCLRDPASNIPIKAMVINSLEFLKKGAGPAENRVLPPSILLAPDPKTGKDAGPARFFDFFFVWADTDREHEDRGFALLGERFRFVENSTIALPQFQQESKIIGWVDKSRLCFWRTREALQWDDTNPNRKQAGRAYPTPEHAKSEIDPATFPPPARPQAVVTEVLTAAGPIPWEPRRMRYPLLTMRVNTPKGEEERPYLTFQGNTLRRVGVIGDVYDEAGKPVMTEKLRQDIQDDIIRTRRQLSRTEVLFVIDRTGSMKDSWKYTADLVKKLIAQVDSDGRSAAIGFCYYGDINAGAPNEGQFARLGDLKGKAVLPGRLLDTKTDKLALERELEVLADQKKEMDGGRRPELVYAGVEIGLMEAKGWSKHARKLVVLIGDDGNHPLPAEEEKKVHDRIAELCAPLTDAEEAGEDYETPKEFYVLQVNEFVDKPGDPTALFKAQAEALGKRITARSKFARFGYYHAGTSETEFRGKIEERYLELKAHADRQEAELQKIQTGQIGSVTQIRDPEVVNILKSIAAKRKLNVNDLLRGAQAFDVRYVWDVVPKTDPAVPQTRRMILVGKGELRQLLRVFEDFFNDREFPPSLEELAARVIAIQANDPEFRDRYKGKSDREKLEALAVMYGLQFVSELEEYLGYNRKPGDPPPKRDPAAELRLKQKLQKKYYLLQDLLAEKVYEYGKLNAADAVELKRLGGKDLPADNRRGFTRGNTPDADSAVFYWIDFEKEWP